MVKSNETNTDFMFALSQLMLALAGKCLSNAKRFDEDKIPTYGLYVAEQAFTTAYNLIKDQSLPVPEPIIYVFEPTIKTAGIGIQAWAQSLKDDWSMISPKCSLHCKTCTSHGTALYFESLSKLLSFSRKNFKGDDKIIDGAIKSCGMIHDSINNYIGIVRKTLDWREAWQDWQTFGEELYSLAEPLSKILLQATSQTSKTK
jgi:hypothetical protein